MIYPGNQPPIEMNVREHSKTIKQPGIPPGELKIQQDLDLRETSRLLDIAAISEKADTAIVLNPAHPPKPHRAYSLITEKQTLKRYPWVYHTI